MTYDSRKVLRGQEYVAEVELQLDACRYTQGLIFTGSRSLSMAAKTDSYTGAVAVSGGSAGWAAAWSGVSPIYMRAGDSSEIILITIDSDSQVTIVTRAQLGTAAESFSGDEVRVMHQGEADSSCVGFPHDCSSPDSYDSSIKLNMIFSTAQNAGGVRRFPGLFHRSVRHDQGEVDPGETIGTRSKLSFSIADGTHNDFGIVPYVDRRTTSGTMFGKLLARHPYFVGRSVKFREGYRDANTFSEPDFIERTFTIDSANLSKDQFSIVALDPLILTEDKKAKIPTASPMILSAGITGATTVFSYIDAPDYYAGAMSATVFLRIDSEVIEATVTGAKQFTVVTRGYRSEEKDHQAGATIQDCVRFSGTHGIDAIEYALQNYTRIDASYIGDYTAVKALLPAFTLDDAIITKPRSVVGFINDLVKIGNLIFYFDQVLQEIVINYIPEVEAEAIAISESDHIERDSVDIDQNTKEQWTRLTHMWAPVDVTKDTEENFGVIYQQVNANLEADGEMGEVNEKKEFKNLLLSNSSGDSLQATSYVDRVLQATERPPKIVKMKLNAANVGATQGGNLSLGSIISLNTFYSQDKNGDPTAELYQVLSLKGDGYTDYMAKMRRYQAVIPDVIDFTISSNKVNYDLSSEYAPSAGSYVIYISPGVTISSTSTSIQAFTTGTQAAGVSFKIINRGSILGMSGRGGDASIDDLVAGDDGEDGGKAFNATVDCEIDNGQGLIWAGGGGGGGGGYYGSGTPYYPRYGGSGGQGAYLVAGGQNAPSSGVYSGAAPQGTPSAPGGGVYPGGAWGEDGTTVPGVSSIFTAAGGLAGIAISKNGKTVTILSGDNEFNIKGRRL